GAAVAPAPAPSRVEPARAVPPVADAAAAVDAPARTHVVRGGETLGRIAATYYGQANVTKGVKLILEANRDRVESASRLRINTELAIPPMK
ncbi:MAG: LysM domain-containing protein, partial [Planctomycetota bacterium]|nr:LysM domain-containing protein [Planctomycetota bacterium]